MLSQSPRSKPGVQRGEPSNIQQHAPVAAVEELVLVSDVVSVVAVVVSVVELELEPHGFGEQDVPAP